MKSEKIIDAVGIISSKHIDKAETVRNGSKRKYRNLSNWQPVIALAACMAIVIGVGAFFFWNNGIEPTVTLPDNATGEPRVKYMCYGKEFIPLEYLIGYEVPSGTVGGELLRRLPQDVTDEMPTVMLYKGNHTDINLNPLMISFDVEYSGTYSNIETMMYDSNFNEIGTAFEIEFGEYYLRQQGRWTDVEDSYGWCEFEYFIKVIIDEQREMTLDDVCELSIIGKKLVQYDFLPFVPNEFDRNNQGIHWRSYELNDSIGIIKVYYERQSAMEVSPSHFSRVDFWLQSKDGSIDLGEGLDWLEKYLNDDTIMSPPM